MAMPALCEDVENRLRGLSKSVGHVDPKDILEVVQSVMASIEGDHSSLSQRLHADIEALAAYINTAKAEITEIGADKINTEYLPEASDQLSAIVGATEQATNEIFEAVELIEELASTMAPEQAERIIEAVTRVYEACSFQDITGQRISKVVTALQNVESRVDALLQAFGEEAGAANGTGAPAEVSTATEPGARPDEDLMHGPQLPGEGNSQEDIDALLNSFD
ncbi:MAG: protein phosphatase CheZ [Planctomycetes bacterium]|nr:protein phosphatase CheZ [Planctomycetota bacterium]